MAELLLELLSEEIPARMQARAADDFKRLVCDGLAGAGLTFDTAHAYATPRRLALVVDGLPAARADVSEERRGPRVGAPDQAVQGFLKATGLASLDEAEKRDTGKGEFWFAVIRKKGGPTADALPGIVEAAMKALPWPKSMKWGSGTMTWVRPLHSIVALFDGKVLQGEVSPGGRMAPVRFGNTTRGHRFLSRGAIEVAGFADYEAKLRAAHVILDPAERKQIVLQGAERLCLDAQVSLRNDEALLDEVAGLVEWPVPLIGTIDAQFMGVPPEVLIVSMKTHQRYFATTTKGAALGIIRIVVENRLRLPLRTFFAADDLMAFFADRLKVQMREKGVRHDVVDAVLALGDEDDLVRLLARVEAVQAFLGTEAGRNLLTAYGRAANIVRAEEKKDKTLAARIAGAPQAGLLEQAEETAVADALAGLERVVRPALQREDFAGAMAGFAGLRGPIDAFFEKVTVNVADNADLRLNRLKLLNQIRATMDSVADFSRIEG